MFALPVEYAVSVVAVVIDSENVTTMFASTNMPPALLAGTRVTITGAALSLTVAAVNEARSLEAASRTRLPAVPLCV